MNCMEHPDAIPPFGDCRCPACFRAREESIPSKLRSLARRQMESPWSIGISDAIIHRAISTYLGGHIGLMEMQVDLIAALATQVDKQHKMLMDVEAMKPIALTVKAV